MKPETWKAIAIISIALLVLETSYIIWAVKVYSDEVVKVDTCYYDICSGYPEAYLEGEVCFCYEYDVLGDLVVGKTEVMK